MYKITFVDGTKFKGGDLFDSKWHQMPKKVIKKLTCTLLGKTKELSNYEAYNFLMERVGVFQGGKMIKSNCTTAVMILGLVDGLVDVWRFDLKTNTVYCTRGLPKGAEYNNQPTTGWKPGINK